LCCGNELFHFLSWSAKAEFPFYRKASFQLDIIEFVFV